MKYSAIFRGVNVACSGIISMRYNLLQQVSTCDVVQLDAEPCGVQCVVPCHAIDCS